MMETAAEWRKSTARRGRDLGRAPLPQPVQARSGTYTMLLAIWRQKQPRMLQKGKRYRLVFDNQTDDAHPIHLHRNSFELTKVHGKPTAGILKDVVLVKRL